MNFVSSAAKALALMADVESTAVSSQQYSRHRPVATPWVLCARGTRDLPCNAGGVGEPQTRSASVAYKAFQEPGLDVVLYRATRVRARLTDESSLLASGGECSPPQSCSGTRASQVCWRTTPDLARV